ncbi:hypothetical protein B0H17DRAFT_1138153 [Mycena rosella]|uniref:Uncharacterized protein n=1 Tax=Mycena rosella TaxID=1033263 RepID=A0AAD7GA00_MYCRO|nr:hypothetical protein B0H17DRAFT_1138153 [Mycena rosella]
MYKVSDESDHRGSSDVAGVAFRMYIPACNEPNHLSRLEPLIVRASRTAHVLVMSIPTGGPDNLRLHGIVKTKQPLIIDRSLATPTTGLATPIHQVSDPLKYGRGQEGKRKSDSHSYPAAFKMMLTAHEFPLQGCTSPNTSAPIQQSPGHLDLYIAASAVRLYDPDTEPDTSSSLQTPERTVRPPIAHPGFMRLLSGPLSDFTRYCREEHSKWLLDLAHDICDPLAMRGLLDVWDQTQQMWRPVAPTDPLAAAVYCYTLPPDTFVGLSKISTRKTRSKTSSERRAAANIRSLVLERDEACWVTGMCPPVNSLICPKRMGAHLARRVLADFCPQLDPSPNRSVDDPIFGLALHASLNRVFETHSLGLRAKNGTYECHLFQTLPPNKVFTIFGGADSHLPLAMMLPPLHGAQAHPPNPLHAETPPAGLFRWHYLQCVIGRFAHADYTELGNIRYSELAIPLQGDSDDDAESEADRPSAVLDT